MVVGASALCVRVCVCVLWLYVWTRLPPYIAAAAARSIAFALAFLSTLGKREGGAPPPLRRVPFAVLYYVNRSINQQRRAYSTRTPPLILYPSIPVRTPAGRGSWGRESSPRRVWGEGEAWEAASLASGVGVAFRCVPGQ